MPLAGFIPSRLKKSMSFITVLTSKDFALNAQTSGLPSIPGFRAK
jgi:hypothetical protein